MAQRVVVASRKSVRAAQRVLVDVSVAQLRAPGRCSMLWPRLAPRATKQGTDKANRLPSLGKAEGPLSMTWRLTGPGEA